jgi:hypothetical protein
MLAALTKPTAQGDAGRKEVGSASSWGPTPGGWAGARPGFGLLIPSPIRPPWPSYALLQAHFPHRLLIPLLQFAVQSDTVEAELLRSLQWLATREAGVGRPVFLDMPEMGVRGEALVRAIEPCPPLEAGDGRLVTAAFRHSRGAVYDLTVAGEGGPLGVTGAHPFWSADRAAWVPAQGLRAGGRLRGLGGAPAVQALALRAGPEPVYNVEVEGDHCYRVGELGLLVHNASDPCGCLPTVVFRKSVVPNVVANIRAALRAGHPRILHYVADRSTHDANRQAACGNVTCPGRGDPRALFRIV